MADNNPSKSRTVNLSIEILAIDVDRVGHVIANKECKLLGLDQAHQRSVRVDDCGESSAPRLDFGGV